MRLPFPMCFKCNKPVSHMWVDYPLGVPEAHITVACHGEKETCILSMDTVVSALRVGPGYAFKPKNEDGSRDKRAEYRKIYGADH